MKAIKTKTVMTINFKVTVEFPDIVEGKCMVPGKCMEKIAIERALRDMDPKGGDHHVRIDAGMIKFNYKGFRWIAPTPKIAKNNLIQFDKEVHIRKRAESKGEPFVSKCKPHTYTVIATATTKILPHTPEQAAYNRVRRARLKKEGRPLKRTQPYHRLRVTGVSASV